MKIHIERGLKRSPDQLPAQTRLSCETRPSCLELYQVGLENLQEWRLCNLCVQFVPLLDWHGENVSPYIHFEPLLFQGLLFLILQPRIAINHPYPFP